MDARRRRDLAAAAALCALVFAVYARLLGGGAAFVFDDHRFIADNPHVKAPASWLAFLTDPNTTDPNSPTGIVRPLRTLEFAIDAAVFGMSPAWFRVHSLLWFAAGACAVYVLLRDVLLSRAAAFAGAALFVVHPMQTECAAWISSRGDLAMGALSAASLAAAVRSRGFDRPLLASAALALVAMLYKETAIVLGVLAPPVMLAAAAARGETQAIRRHALVTGGVLLAVAAAYWFGFRMQVQIGGLSHVHTYVMGGSTAGTLATMARGFGAYLGFTVLPTDPACDWNLPVSMGWSDPASLAWAAAHVALGLWALRAAWRGSPLGAAVVVFYAALLPVANWPFALGIATAERFLHLPLVGAALAFAAACRALGRRAAAPVAVALVACAAISAHRAADWRSDDALWRATRARVESPRAIGYFAGEERTAAFAELTAARNLPAGPERAAATERALARFRGASDLAHRAIRLWLDLESREFSWTHWVVPPHVTASNCAWHLGDFDEALRHAHTGRIVAPDVHPQTHYNLALGWLREGRGANAVRAAEEALRLGMGDEDDETDERDEIALIQEAAAWICADDGEHQLARIALAGAAAHSTRGAEFRRALDEYARSRAARIESLRAARDASSPASRAALAVELASDGGLEEADRIEAELRAAGTWPAAAEVLWVHARFESRPGDSGLAEALRRYDMLGDAPGARFRAALCAEALHRWDAPLAARFRAVAEGPGASAGGPDTAYASRAVRRLVTPCPRGIATSEPDGRTTAVPAGERR